MGLVSLTLFLARCITHKAYLLTLDALQSLEAASRLKDLRRDFTTLSFSLMRGSDANFRHSSSVCGLASGYNVGTRSFFESMTLHYREKWSSLSEFIREIKLDFSRYYNKRHNRRGYFWGDRFKSVIVEDGETLINCLAYIDLNPVRAAIVERPEDYRWSSIGYHVQSGNKGDFLSLDFDYVSYTQKNIDRFETAYEAFRQM